MKIYYEPSTVNIGESIGLSFSSAPANHFGLCKQSPSLSVRQALMSPPQRVNVVIGEMSPGWKPMAAKMWS